LSTSGLAQLNTVNAKQGYGQEQYDADYLDEVRAKEKRLEKERRREEREVERERRRASRHVERDERKRMSEMEQSQGEQTDRERRREEERERRREEKRQQRRAEKMQAKAEEKEKQRQLELAQEQAEAEARERQRHAEREKQRQLRREQRESEKGQRRERPRDYDDYDEYNTSPARTPHKSKWRGGAAYGEVDNEDSPRAKYFEKTHSPKKKSRVISGPYLEDQHDEVYEYRKDKLDGSSQASDYTSTTIWKKKRNKRICECLWVVARQSLLTTFRHLCWSVLDHPRHCHSSWCCSLKTKQQRQLWQWRRRRWWR
jgi:glucan 1,3-beta-glucosidase